MHDGGDGFEELGRFVRKLRGDKVQASVANRIGLDTSVICLAEQGKVFSARTAKKYDDHYAALGAIGGGEIVAMQRDAERARKQKKQDEGKWPCLHGDLAALAQAGGGVVVVMPLHGAAPESGQLIDMSDGRNLALPDGMYRVITSTGDVVVAMAVDRRLFVAGAGLAVPAAALEQTRHGLLGSLVADRSAADADEWQEIAWEYGRSFLRTPPAEMLRSLQVDITAIGDALERERAAPARRELQKVAALLAAFTAITVANLGDLHSARRWWRTAKQAADVSGDIQARLWIRGQEVVRALYEQCPVPVILDMVAEAEAIGASIEAPPTALPQLLTGKAQALALAGQGTQAETTLCEVRENFERMPAHTTRDTGSLLGWYEHNVRFTESYVYSHLGDYARAEKAQTAALALYPATYLRAPVKIKLQRSLCLVRTGDVTTGVEHAYTVMTGLAREQHDRIIIDLGHKVLDAVPAAERSRDGVREFRAYLGHEVATT